IIMRRVVLCISSFLLLIIPSPPRPTLFPYTTLFRSPETLRLAEGYVQVQALGPMQIKGLSGPLEVYELIGAGSVRSRLQAAAARSEEHTSELQSPYDLVCRLLLEKKKNTSHRSNQER